MYNVQESHRIDPFKSLRETVLRNKKCSGSGEELKEPDMPTGTLKD